MLDVDIMESKDLDDKEEGNINIKHIYTPLSVAKEEVWRRWNDKDLRQKVEEFLNGDIPEFLQNEPKSYLARHVASPNFEFTRFLELAGEIDLNPVCPEY